LTAASDGEKSERSDVCGCLPGRRGRDVANHRPRRRRARGWHKRPSLSAPRASQSSLRRQPRRPAAPLPFTPSRLFSNVRSTHRRPPHPDHEILEVAFFDPGRPAGLVAKPKPRRRSGRCFAHRDGSGPAAPLLTEPRLLEAYRMPQYTNAHLITWVPSQPAFFPDQGRRLDGDRIARHRPVGPSWLPMAG